MWWGRVQKGLTLQEFAKLLGVPWKVLDAQERGTRFMRMDQTQEAAALLGVPLQDREHGRGERFELSEQRLENFAGWNPRQALDEIAKVTMDRQPIGFDAPFNPSVEVGWRLKRSAWGKGYALEAARAAITDGFERVGLDAIVSMTAVTNERSQAVMRRLGMTHDPAEDFEHPRVPEGSPLRPHVLFRLRRDDWVS